MDDREWFRENLDDIISMHRGRLVSVLNGRIIAVGDDLDEIMRLSTGMKRRGELRGTPFTGKADRDIALAHYPPMRI